MRVNGAKRQRADNKVRILIGIDQKAAIVHPASKNRAAGHNSHHSVAVFDNASEGYLGLHLVPEDDPLIEGTVAGRSEWNSNRTEKPQPEKPSGRPGNRAPREKQDEYSARDRNSSQEQRNLP